MSLTAENFSTTASASSLPSLEEVQSKIQSVRQDSSDYPNADILISTLEATKQSMKNRLQSIESIKTLEAEIQKAPQSLSRATEKLNAPVIDEQIDSTKDLDLETVKRKFNQINTQLAMMRVKLSVHATEDKTRTQRQDEIPGRIAELKTSQLELTAQPQPQNTSKELEKAQFNLNLAKQEELLSEISNLDIELLSIRATNELFTTQKLFITREITRLEKSLALWQNILNEKERALTTSTQNTAEDFSKRFKGIPALSKITKETIQQAQLRSTLSARTLAAKRFEETISMQRQQTMENRINAQQRINLLESAGLPIDLQTGSLLRAQRAKLPTIKALKADLESNIKASTTAQLEKLALADQIAALPLDIDSYVTEIMGRIPNQEINEDEVQKLIEHQKKILNLNFIEYGNYIAILKSTNESARQAIKEVQAYSLYLDERLLWIASAPPISFSDIPVEFAAFREFFSYQTLERWFLHLLRDTQAHPILWALAILLLIYLIYRRRRFKGALKNCGLEAAKRNCLSILPTIQAIWVSFLLALPLAFLCAFLAWRTDDPAEISLAFRNCAPFIGIMGFLRILAKPHGILTSHLDFEKERCAHLSKSLRWIPWIILPLFFVTTILLTDPNHPQSGRLVFIIMLLAIGWMVHLLLRPSKGLIGQIKQSQKFAKFYYLLGIGIPLFFITASCLGYISSVQTLRLQIIGSVLIILIALFTSKILVRWILITRRRLAKDQAAKKHKALVVARQKAKKGESPKDTASLEEIQAHALDVVAVEEQTTQLVRVGVIILITFGLWSIWSTSLPALSILDNVTVWQDSHTSETTVNNKPNITDTFSGSNATPEASDSTTKQPNKISLQDLIGSIIIIVLTFIGARNLPGLLELSLLRRLSLQPGVNYAVTTVVRYLIVAVGLLLAFGTIGITWSSVQWLAAAITLGIGFGLQEIFANFVAGIIILFERPIRLGDVVTVGEVSGKVTQIQIRATTIKQFNNRELVVPNKEFITGQLVNWTLNDSILRFDLPVGLAYGSDTTQATKILYEVLSEHPNVLKEPKPEVLFTAFGSSSLDFIVRGHVHSVENLVPTQSSLHYNIDERFREAHIEIAFPQTDIHIRSLPETSSLTLTPSRTPPEN